MPTCGARRRHDPRPRRAAAAARAIAALAAGSLLAFAWARPAATAIAAGQTPQPPAGAVKLADLLTRAGDYVVAFENSFSNVVTEERYAQEVVPPNNPAVVIPLGRGGAGTFAYNTPSIQRRELVSDFLLVKLPSEEWLPFRDVFEVDRQRVRDRQDRLTKLFLQPAGTSFDQALRIMEESARYNIGNIQRTINLPVLALLVLRPVLQPHFRFTLGKPDGSLGPGVYTIEYRETVSPTLVHGAYGRDLFCHGRFWIHAPTGRVMKSEFIIDDPLVRAIVTTRYQVDEATGLAVPVDMREDYSLVNRSKVTGLATYGKFRRFDVKVADKIADPPRTITDPFSGMTLVELKPGRFMMGSPSSESGRNDDETQHEAAITRSFFLGQFEVNQDQWRKVMNTSPGQFASCGLSCPVERVSFDDVQRFVEALNAHASDVRYRLPSETEWEYACRAGTSTPFATGWTITTAQANFNGTRPYESSLSGVYREQPTPSGTFDANAWGLGDMHGNVREWTADWYGPYPRAGDADAHGPASGISRVVRGGSWQSDGKAVRCAVRESRSPTDRQSTLGFRVAADLATRP